jgi:RNA polymerase sigma factor (sigma-70 family)
VRAATATQAVPTKGHRGASGTDGPAWPVKAPVCTIGQMPRGRTDAVTAMGDRELVGNLAAGDAAALAEIYRRYVGLVFGLARRVLGDETLAEDVTQEVFVYLWRQPERFDASRGTLRSWLGLLAHRRSVDLVRNEARRSRTEGRCDPDPATGLQAEVDEYLAAGWLSGRVRVAIDELPPEQREAVMLAYFGGRTYRQVAIELAIPEGTAKSRLRLALGKLDELLRPALSGQDAPAWT